MRRRIIIEIHSNENWGFCACTWHHLIVQSSSGSNEVSNV